MRRRDCLLERGAIAVAAVCTMCLSAFAESPAITVRNPSSGRTWQIARTGTVRVPWPAGAAKARLSTVDRLRNVPVADQEAVHVDGSQAVVFTLPAGDGSEACYDLTLTFADAGETVVETKTARVVRLAETVNLQVPESKGWKRMRAGGGRLAPYDRLWDEASASADTAYLAATKDGVTTPTALSGTSGWEALAATDTAFGTDRKLSLALGFGAADPLWSAELRLALGLVFLVR